ncbi:apolipophorins-like [Ischnura elegans]|uniref:apolipophorins-like n=1 Tax=Ischnura elegans TaxID=197161 RepID=UPI001ED88219|nr:apolipophorins-like [Ischnura elegans]
MAKWIVLALVALTALKDAATDSPRKCSKGCGTAPQHDFKFNVQPGHTYVYYFEASTETSVPGAAVTCEDEEAGGHKAPGGQRLHITGRAELHTGANCDHVMQLLQVHVTGADGKKFQDFASCERHPLGFSWNNGRLGTDVCVEDGDTPVDVNVKRAILSLMQVSKVQPSGSASLHETDIFGVCPTDFTYHEEGGVLKVTKHRNLNRCAHREGLHNNFFSTYYDEPSELHSSPLLQSTLQVEQTIKDKMVVSAVGEESYLFRPFSNGGSGAQTTVTTRLTLVKHQPSPAPPVTNGHGSSILFDAHKWNLGGANPEDQATVEHVTHALKAAEKSLVGGASTESAGAFRSLTRVMRYANAECLMSVYSQVKAGTGFTSKKLAKSVFLDALRQTGTGQSIEAVVQLINAKELSPEVSKLYYLGFSFIRHATRGSLKAVASLLESPSLPLAAYLGAGALVGRYCSEHQCDDTIPEFKVLVGKLAHKLGKGCKPVNREHENEIVGALKGLQNAKKLTAEAADAIMKCAVNDVPTRVRVAALDAFLGDPCQQKLNKTALEMMKNRDLDSELRIKAYLAVTECPCEAVANAVKEMMKDEPIHQVGSFVSSHLFTLRTSSNPDKAQAKHYLGGIRPKKRYPFDPTKFSRAYESSYSMDGLNLATSAEGNVIFSQKSFVPRSASLNLTTSLFGHNFNLFEVGVRAENVDLLLESLLGPRGYFKTHKPKEIMDEVKHDFEEAMEHIEKRARAIRTRGMHVPRHVFRKKVDALGKKVGHSVDHDDHSLDVDIHMKLFGSEVGWANYHGTLPKMPFKSGIDKFFDHVDDGINKTKDYKLDVSPNLAIFDCQLVYPTGAGFSLILDASAYSSVYLKVESQGDILALMRYPGNSKFHMKLLPSASVEISGAMFVDAFANVMAGLEVVGNVHSSTGFGLDVQALKKGFGMEVKFGVPKPKQEVFSFHSQVMSVRREKGHAPVHAPVKFYKVSKSYLGCFEQLTPLTGLVFCGEVKFPWDGLSSAVVPKPNQALFPLDGPLKLSFHIEKENEALTHYYFRQFLDIDFYYTHFEMKFDTPNSKVDRAVQFDLEARYAPYGDKAMKVDVKTPWIKFILEGTAIGNATEHSLMGKYVSEGNEYMAKLGLVLKSASGNKREYTPTIEVNTPEKKKVGKGPKGQKAGTKNLSIEGTITIEDYNARNPRNPHKRVFTFNRVKLVTNKAKYGLEGIVERGRGYHGHSFSYDLKLKYDTDLRHYFALKGNLYESIKFLEHGLKVDAEFTASQFPEVGFHVKLDSQIKPVHVENIFDLIHGPDLKSEMAHLHISNIYVFKHESDSNYHVSVNNRVTYPLAGLEGKLMGEVKPGHVQYEIDAKYDKHQVDSALDFKYGETPEEGYDFKWGVVVFGNGFQLDSKRVVSSPKNSKVDVCLELKHGGRKYVLESDLTNSNVGEKQFDFRANSVLKIPGYQHYRLDGGAAMDAYSFKTHFEAYVGKVCYVNLRAHGELDSDGQCKSAEWSSLLLNHLQGSGHYSSDSKGTKGDFLVHLIKSDRKLKGDFSNVHSEDGICKTLANFFWDAEKDPSKKLHFESVNHVQPSSVDSKNKLVILGETTQVDVKISAQGKMTVGSGIVDVDIHLPSGRHIYLKSQTKMNLPLSSEGDSDGEAHVTICDKHSGGESCLKVHEVMSNYNLEKGSYVCSSDSTYLRRDGKELKFGVELKILPKDEKTEMSGKAYVSGSLLGQVKPMSVEWGGEAVNGDYSYHALGKLGEDQSLGVKGKLDSSGDSGKTKVGEFHIDAQTNVENLKHVSFGQVAKVTHVSADVYDFTSSSDLKWGSDKKLTLGAKVHKDNHKGSASVTMCLPGDTEDHVVMVEWSDEAVNPKVEGSVAFMWPQGKKMKFEMQAATPKDSLSLHLTAHTPVKGHEKMELILNHKNLKALYVMETDVTLVASPEHKFSVHSRVEYPQNKRVVDLSVTREGGPTNKVHARLEKEGDNHFERAVLVLPKRTLTVVATFEAKPNVGEYAHIHSGVSVWLDKERHPELKTSGSFVVLAKVKVPELAIKTEAKLSHPSLGRDLAIRGELECSATNIEFDSKLEFDVFAEEDQKVVVSAKLDKVMQENGGNLTAMVDFKSKGQKIDAEWVTYGFYAERSLGLGSFFTYVNHNNEHRDTGAVFRVNPKSLFLLVKADSHEVLKADLKADISEAKQVLVSEIGVLGKHTHVDTYEFSGVDSFKYSSHEKGSPDDQIEAHGTLVWDKAFEVHADRLKGGQKEVLAHLFVNLNKENFFDVKHTWEQDHVKQYVSDVMNDYKFMREKAEKMADEMRQRLQADGKHFLELLKKASPNVKPLLESYQKQLIEMKDEILNDEYVHEVVVALKKAVHALQAAFAQTIEKLRHMNEEFEKVWRQNWLKVLSIYDEMAPAVRESVGKVVAAVCEGFEKFSHYLVEALEKVFGYMQQFSGEFKAVGKVIVQFIQDVAQTVVMLLDEAKFRFEEWKRMAAEHLQAVPAFEMVKEYYDGFMANLPETVNGVFSEVIATLKESKACMLSGVNHVITEVMAALKESAPTVELTDFLNALENYLKELQYSETDDQAELKNLYYLFVKAIKSLEDSARSLGHDLYPKDFSLSQFPFWLFGSGPMQSLFTLDDIARLPFFFAVRASPFFYKVDDFPTPKELFSEFVPTLLKGQLPPQEAHAFLVGGEHFFTFDNRHYTLSGCACDYVLAQDFEDGNFSIVGHYEGGKLMSITLVDPKDMFELSMDLTLKVNGQPSEFPVRHNTMSAWSEFDVVSMKTAYGAKVTCDRRFKDVCMVSINGYYFGKTRGLLGTLNNEPYDDYVMPSGKVAPTVDKLANSWKADALCADVAAQTHVHEHAKQCSDIFAGYSPMRVCFPVVDPAPFREACDADIAMRSGDACKFSAAYAAACYFNGVKVRVPDQCAQCKVGGNSVQHGFSVSLKAPQGKADIVLAVEQAPQNEVLLKDLLVPLVASITNDLKAHKIFDVKFILIGYGEHNNTWPNIFTTNGQVGFDGKGENVHFPAHTPEDKLVLDGLHPDVEKFVQMVDRLNKLVKVEFARLPYADAFYLAREYPFRPGAAKAVISLMHSRCLYSPLPVSTQSVRLFLQKKQYEMSGVAFHVLSPITFTSASRDRKQIRKVVGLDKKGVFSLGDARKKVLDGDVEFRKDLSYDADVCVDFAQATNGGAYSTRNFAELPKPGFKKQFTNVVSQRVVQSLSPEFTEECTCQLYHGWHPVTRCRVTSRKESARLTTKSAELELRIPALGLSVIIGGVNSESVE